MIGLGKYVGHSFGTVAAKSWVHIVSSFGIQYLHPRTREGSASSASGISISHYRKSGGASSYPIIILLGSQSFYRITITAIEFKI